MEEIITPYVTADDRIFMYVTQSQLIAIRIAIDALNKRRILLRNKMAERRDIKGPTKAYKPIIKIDFPKPLLPSNLPKLLPVNIPSPPVQSLSIMPQYIPTPVISMPQYPLIIPKNV
jgi:hypothetical protein